MNAVVTRNPLRDDIEWQPGAVEKRSAAAHFKAPETDDPAAFSSWTMSERLAFVEKLQSVFDSAEAEEIHPAGAKPPTSALRAAALSYLELINSETGLLHHTGNQLMPSQTKAHRHSLALIALLADALYVGFAFRWLAKPVVIRGSRAIFTAGPDREEFGTLVQAAPASARGYFQYK
jgi:hypothetical protein